MRTRDFLPVYASGILTGIVVAGLVWIMASPIAASELGQLFKEWGTPVGVYLALATYITTLVTGWLAHRRQRKANLASLGVDLSSICAYSEDCMHLAYRLSEALRIEELAENFHTDRNYTPDRHAELQDRAREARANVQGWVDTRRVPIIDQTAIDRIATGAGSLGDKRLSDLLNTYQVQRARLTDDLRRYLDGHPHPMHTSVLTRLGVVGRIEDAARLYELASRLFDLPREDWDFYETGVSSDQIDKRASFAVGVTPSEEKAAILGRNRDEQGEGEPVPDPDQ